MSGHVGDATASPPTSKRDERYYLIERRCKDLCLYLDVLTRNMPRYEKYILSAKMRALELNNADSNWNPIPSPAATDRVEFFGNGSTTAGF